MHGNKRIDALKLLIRVSRPHRPALVYGLIATVFVVFMRIALPWPLRGIIEAVFPGQGGPSSTWLPQEFLIGNPILMLCGAYFLISLATGLFEQSQRVWMATVASRTARDLRAEAVRGARTPTWRDPADRADLITRIIGDSARVRADVKGILIHGSQNGLLLIGITVLFLFLAPSLGILFLLSGVFAVVIGYRTVEEVARTATRQRKKESRYASLIDSIDENDDPEHGQAINVSSAQADVRTTRIIGRSSVLVYGGVAAIISIALWIGIRSVHAGTLAPGVLFLFIAYAISIQRRAVRVGRQIARGGKLLANAHRIGVLASGEKAAEIEPLRLRSRLRLEAIRLRSGEGHGRRTRLGPLDLEIRRGEKLLVIGGEGAGKTTLLRVLSGVIPASRGRYLWDDEDVTATPERLWDAVSHAGDEPSFRATNIGGAMGLDGGREPTQNEVLLAKKLGAWRAVRGLAGEIEEALDSSSLSWSERRAVGVVRTVCSDRPVWLFDCPVSSTQKREAGRIETILSRAEDRTVVVTLRRPVHVERFTHVLVLRRGRQAFHGTPDQWRRWKQERPTAVERVPSAEEPRGG